MKKVLILTLTVICLIQVNAQTWNEKAKLVASDRETLDRFSESSISISGDYAIVGAHQEGEDAAGGNTLSGSGSAYIYEKDKSGNWNQVQKIVASDRENQDNFGWSVSISGNYAIVGAKDETVDPVGGNSLFPGSAYIFERDGSGVWNQVQKIVAAERENELFGESVSISGNYAIVGAIRENEDAAGEDSLEDAGAAYIFERDGSGVWNEVQMIVASDREAGDFFGSSVSMSDSYAIVGAWREDENVAGGDSLEAAGSAYIFERDESGVWNEVQKIVASDRALYDWFAFSTAISGNYAIIGVHQEDEDAGEGNTMADAGSAYIFERDGSGVWNEVQKIVPADRASSDMFGFSVSISGNHAIAGAWREDEDAAGANTVFEAGSAYIFERDGSGVWNEVQKIVASDRDMDDRFGEAVSISGNHAIVGAWREDEDASGGNTLSRAGSAYVFGSLASTGVRENDFGASLRVYPNPTQGKLTIDLGQSYHEADITIRNIIGQVIFTKKDTKTHLVSFEIAGPAGIYLVEIQTAQGKSAMLKVIKE